MDTDTALILGLLAAAFSCWFTILIVEKRQLIKQWKKNEQDRMGRAERVKQLSKKL
jgi:hypothetical protein